MGGYVPGKGDFVALSFDPQSGHEQKGRRPALVVSNDLFNQRTGMAMVCPITNTDRRFPFHVPIPPGLAVAGFVMVEQVKSVDFRSRQVTRIGIAPPRILDEVLAILDACIY
ncbi:MAG: type II toxin-antitoxin system PemK/MazF family toxin [Planctomycetota bacterium]|nr:type II toxin-antitoxin system PemK/MazF family toxin [Planctomycetota bacterium]